MRETHTECVRLDSSASSIRGSGSDVNIMTGDSDIDSDNDSDADNTDATKSTPFLSSYTRAEFVTLGVLVVARVFGGLFYSLLAPFFPTEVMTLCLLAV